MGVDKIEEWMQEIDLTLWQPIFGANRACTLCMGVGYRGFWVFKAPRCERCVVSHWMYKSKGVSGSITHKTPCEVYLRGLVKSGEIVPNHCLGETMWEAKFVKPILKEIAEWLQGEYDAYTKNRVQEG